MESGSNIRLAMPGDLPAAMALVRAAIRRMAEQGIHQWDDVYPSEDVIRCDIGQESLHVLERDGALAGMIVLNEVQDPQYTLADWLYQGRVLVVHRLTLAPEFQGKGLGKRLMAFAEETARAGGYDAVRLDAFTRNPAAVALYEKLHYRKAGTVPLRKGDFHCFEKRLDPQAFS